PPPSFSLLRPRAAIYTDGATGCSPARRTVMPRRTLPLLLVSLFLILPATANAQDAALAKQRQTADAITKSLQLNSIVTVESKNLILYVTLSDPKVQARGTMLETQFTTAVKALQFPR